MPSIRTRSIDEIKETLENAKSRGRGCVLLIGAGCSSQAGIPTAAGFVDIIRDQYKRAYQRAPEKTYPKCMGELLLSERSDLIARYVANAPINWAHLCIARLMEMGYIDRVLTTNFDLLVARACAMLGVFPAIYDFATSQLLKKADIPDQAVFYLHGQTTGFVLMNTEEDMEKHSKLLGPVFEDAGSGRVWIVVGYSGENDPVFDHLAGIPRFDNGLFWIGYEDKEPAIHVREKLLTQNKDAFFTQGYNADSFFVSLTRALGIFPPDLVARPFTHIQRTLTHIAPFAEPGQTFEDDVMRIPHEWIRSAIDQFETPAWEIIIQRGRPQMDAQKRPGFLAVAARYFLMQGKYEQALAFQKDYDESPSAELAEVLSMAYVMHGNQLLDRAKARLGDDSDRLFLQAKEAYQAALIIEPKRHEALHNWGNLLLDRAKTKPGEEADHLFDQAEEKYKAALDIKSDMYDALYQWGNVFLDRAKTRKGEEADHLFDQAVEKYGAALKINPDMYQALNSLGNLLLDWGKTKSGEEADQLFGKAEKKYEAALEIKADRYDFLNNWGNVLSDRARRKTGEEADRLFAEAQKKYEAALELRSGTADVRQSWGNLLLDWAKAKTGEEAAQLRAKAEEKFQSSGAGKPDTPDPCK